MTRSRVLDLAFVLLLTALPLISLGATRGTELIWIIGLVVLAGGFLLPLALRFVHVPQPPQDEPDVGEEPS